MSDGLPTSPTPPADEVRVDERHAIPRAELVVRVSRAGGAGGQHVNKTSTRVEIVWAPGVSVALDDAERARVVERLAKRLDAEGRVRVVASDTRSQLRNRELAEERLAAIVREALVVERPRKKTRPSRAAREARLGEKKRRGDKKRERRGGRWED
jgi:ribosome-associated protein